MSLLSRCPAWALAACLLAAAPASRAQTVDCMAFCSSGDCVLQTDGSASRKPWPTQGRWIERCLQARLVSSSLPLTVLFQSARGLERFVVAERQRDTEFAQLEPKLKQARCLQSALCLESRDQARVAGVGGKGIDAVELRRVGTPCALGLPCGSILRPAADLPVQLADAGLQGQLQLQARRGASGQFLLPVAGGRFTLPAAALVAGAAYAYVLRDAAGTELAAGGFELLSSRMQADIDAELQALQRSASPTAALERAELLLDSQLYWDAALAAR